MHTYLIKLFKIRGMKLVLEMLIILLVFFAVKSYLQRDLAQGVAPAIGDTLLDGQPVDLHSLRGKTVLLYFWATWCPVCKIQHGAVAAVNKDYTVVSIAMNSGTDLEINNFLQQRKLDFPVISDENGVIARQFGISGVPTSFIIDPNGNIAFTETGYTTEWGLRFRLWMADK